jgi:predicted  nucleic acid-binding Zn-ribbon protein
LREGFAELGRKIERSKLRKRLRQHDREQQEALIALGRRAWAEKVDISAFADLGGQLAASETRANAVAQGIQNLEAERQRREGERRAAIAKFDEQRRACEGAKKPVDAALQAARGGLSEQDRAIRTTEARLAAVGAELAGLERQLVELEGSTAAKRAEQISAARAKQQQLSSEQERLQSELPTSKAASEPQAAEVNRLWQESQRHQQQIDALEAERKSVLAPLDAALSQVREGLSAAGRESNAVEQERTERFRQLGLALYQRQPADPRLDEAIRRIAALDREREAVNAALVSSQGLTQTLPRGTMLKFSSALILAVVVVIGVGFGAAWLLSPSSEQPNRLESQSSLEAGATWSGAATEELEKDGAVSAFLEARSAGKTPDAAAEEKAVEVLRDDLLLLGSNADPAYLPVFTKVLRSDEPKLRAAAASAIGMVRPGSAEVPVLINALNDPVPAVRQAALAALEQVKQDSGSRLLVRRVQAGATDRPSGELFTPEPAPDAKQLGVPIYEGATFLYFASNPTIGRAAFATSDSVQKVLDFYTAKAQRPPLPGAEFTRMYFGGSSDDPTGAKRLAAETQAWMERMLKANKASSEIEAEGDRRAGLMIDLPLIRYADAELYGAPSYVALEETSSEGMKKAARYVVVFEDHTLGRTGFEVHVAPEAQRN